MNLINLHTLQFGLSDELNIELHRLFNDYPISFSTIKLLSSVDSKGCQIALYDNRIYDQAIASGKLNESDTTILNKLINITALFSVNSDGLPIIYINLGKFGLNELVPMLRHEMVHYDQWARGDFRVLDGDSGIVWRGREYSSEELESISEYDKPWEREAYGLMYTDEALTELTDLPEGLVGCLKEFNRVGYK